MVKCVLNYLKGTSEQGLIIKPDPEKGIELYVDADFAGGYNQEGGKDTGSFLIERAMKLVTPTAPTYGQAGSRQK